MGSDGRARTSTRPAGWAAAAVALVLVAATTTCAAPAPARGRPDPPPTTAPAPAPAPVVEVVRDVRYGPHPQHLADLHVPPGGGRRGVIVLVHGGGFVRGGRGELLDTGGPVVDQLRRGFALLDVEYRLTDGEEHTFPTAVQDVALAVEWVRRHGADLGVDPRAVLVAGSSAGGTIAALVGLGSNAAPGVGLPRTPRVDGWVSLAGIHDFVTPSDAAHFGVTWVGGAPPDAAALAAASPVTHLDRDDPPGYVVHGDKDTVVPMSQALLMVAAASSAGASASLSHDLVGTGPGSCRWHFPACGMDAAAFDAWVDRVTAPRV